MRHYFRHDADNEFTVWTIKSPKTKPWQGYNTDPYAYTVRKLYESGGSHEYELSDWSDNAEHGALYIRTEVRNLMPCIWNANSKGGRLA